MTEEKMRLGLSGNVLKIIAAVSMLIDHTGVILFPGVDALRIIGRIAFPIFAFMIAEGCFYTRDKLRYFFSVFILGVVCQAVYAIFDGGELGGILITFSLSIIIVYAMQYMKESLLSEGTSCTVQCLSVLLFIAALFGVYFLNEIFYIDYGFFGCMAPAFVSAFKMPQNFPRDRAILLDNRFVHVISLGICLLLLAYTMGGNQIFALFSLPLLLLYSGKRGKFKMKYFFYIFYPLHLAVLEGISYLLK